MKKIVLIIGIAVLGGGGYFGYIKFVQKPEATEEVVAEVEEAEPLFKPAPIKMPIPPLTVSLQNNGIVTHLYGLNMAVELYDEKLLEKAKTLEPRLRGAILKYLLKLSKSAPRLLEDEQFLRRKILEIAEPILTEALQTEQPAVTSIYIHSLGINKSVR